MSRTLYLDVPNCTNVRGASVDSSYSAITSQASIECSSTTLDISDEVTVDLGYDDEHSVVFRGYVKKIEKRRPENTIQITAADYLVRSVDYFIAADSPDTPYQYNDITSLNLIKELLALASVTNVTSVEPTPVFKWGTNPDGARFNLQSVSDAVQTICNITGNTLYYDPDLDIVEFKARKPYVDTGDVASGSWYMGDGGNIISMAYEYGTDKTRNVVKVYGKGDITAKAEAVNPYLVVDQAVVVAHELIDTQTLADNTAAVNLALLNRLTETYTVEILGLPALRARQVYHITDTYTATDRDVFVYQCTHQIDSSGYVCSVTAIP